MNQSENPKVSVIIPCYNAEKYIAAAVHSVLFGAYQNVECVVVDDGSKDQSLNVLKSISDERLKVFSIENSGGGYARNIGIKHASGHYIAFLDSDDLLDKEGLKVLVEKSKNRSADQLVFGIANSFRDEEVDNSDTDKLLKKLLSEAKTKDFVNRSDLYSTDDNVSNLWNYFQKPLSICCVLYTKESLEKINGFNPLLRVGQDTDLYQRILLNGNRLFFEPVYTFHIRGHNSEDRIGKWKWKNPGAIDNCMRVMESTVRSLIPYHRQEPFLRSIGSTYFASFKKAVRMVNLKYALVFGFHALRLGRVKNV